MKHTYKVPIRNLFYLISYANEMPDMVRQLNDVDDDLITYDFLANLFNKEVEGLFRRGLVRHYMARTEETGFISGRLLINESIPHIMRKNPKLVCEKDIYTEDISLNQIIKATLENIYKNQDITKKIRKKSFSLHGELNMVETIPLRKAVFDEIIFHRHNQHYKRIYQLAYLHFEMQLLSHQSGDKELYNLEIRETELNHLFEQFLFNFYRLEQTDYQVKSERIDWSLAGKTGYLPSMLTDVSLIHKTAAEKIIIDAKFYKHIFQINYDKKSFISSHMYQMFAYLSHQPLSIEKIRGILIYPYNGQSIKEKYTWDQRISMQMMTINLSEKWEAIYEELIKVLSD